MQSTLYVTIKCFIGALESINSFSLEIIQCRLLITFYEIGHGTYPAASISIAACARTARALGLNKKQFEVESLKDHAATARAEAEKRAWWAVTNLDR